VHLACLLGVRAVLQVVLGQKGETCTAVHVYRSDFYLSGGGTSSSGGAAAGGEAEESLLLRDWVVGSQVRALLPSLFAHPDLPAPGLLPLLYSSTQCSLAPAEPFWLPPPCCFAGAHGSSQHHQQLPSVN
jgi:hypothetical protein